MVTYYLMPQKVPHIGPWALSSIE